MARISPVTRDFTETARHNLERSATPAEEHMILRLMTERGSCCWDLSFGSTLHELPREKLTTATLRAAEDRVRAALRPMVVAGEIAELSVSAQRAERNRLELSVSAQDQGQRPIAFSVFVEV